MRYGWKLGRVSWDLYLTVGAGSEDRAATNEFDELHTLSIRHEIFRLQLHSERCSTLSLREENVTPSKTMIKIFGLFLVY